MIIQCINCNKKFEVTSSLIPSTGRNVQCGSCHHVWFFNNELVENDLIIEKVEKEPLIDNKKDLPNESKYSLSNNDTEIQMEQNEKIPETIIDNSKLNQLNSSTFKLVNILSYLIVGIFSFVAIIILLDTFKSPLINIFPNLELLLFNLFETIKDIFLFIKDLFL
jgi:predicted Zn finger-like uncharacterized protein